MTEEITTLKTSNLIRAYSNQAHWRINKNLSKHYGLHAALWIADLLSKWDYFRKKRDLKDGYFYNTQEDIKENTGISIEMQAAIIKKLKSDGVLFVQRKGIPSKYYYKFDYKKLFTIMGEEVSKKSDILVSRKTGELESSQTGELNNNKNKEEIRIKKISSSKEEQRVSTKPTPTNSLRPVLKRRSKAQIIRSKNYSLKSKQSYDPLKSYPKPVNEIMSLWLSLGLVRHQPEKKSYDDAMKDLHSIMRGKFFTNMNGDLAQYEGKRFSSEQLRIAVNNFALAALNPDYDPPRGDYKGHLRHCGLSAFLYNSFGRKYKSLFLHYLENRPQVLAMTATPLPDDNQGATKILRDFYIKDILGGIRPRGGGFSQVDENKFIKGAERAVEFLGKNLSSIRGVMREKYKRYPAQFARVLCDALWEHYGEEGLKELGPGVFYTDNTFHKILPAYLHSQAIIETGEGDGIYHGGRSREEV